MSNHKQTELKYSDKIVLMSKNMPDYVKNYIRSIHNRTSPRTRYEYLKDIQNFLHYIDEYFEDITDYKNINIDILKKLDRNFFEEYFEYMEHYERDGREYTNGRSSIKRKLSSLRKFFAYLFESGLIPSDEIRKVELPKLSKKEIIRLENNEAKDLLNAVEFASPNLTKKQKDYHNIQSVRDMAIVYLMLSTGIRVSECAELDINDINMINSSLHIVRKGGDEATVYFSDEASAYIEEYLEYRSTIKGIENEDALFLSSRKTRLSVRAIEVLIKKYAQRVVPNKHITPHKLRSTYATNLYNETGDIYLVAETLGHKDVTTTKEHYANLSNKKKEENRNKVIFRDIQ